VSTESESNSEVEGQKERNFNQTQSRGPSSQCEHESDNEVMEEAEKDDRWGNNDEQVWFEAQTKLESEINRRQCKRRKHKLTRKVRLEKERLKHERRLDKKHNTKQRRKLRESEDGQCFECKEEEELDSGERLDQDGQVGFSYHDFGFDG